MLTIIHAAIATIALASSVAKPDRSTENHYKKIYFTKADKQLDADKAARTIIEPFANLYMKSHKLTKLSDNSELRKKNFPQRFIIDGVSRHDIMFVTSEGENISLVSSINEPIKGDLLSRYVTIKDSHSMVIFSSKLLLGRNSIESLNFGNLKIEDIKKAQDIRLSQMEIFEARKRLRDNLRQEYLMSYLEGGGGINRLMKAIDKDIQSVELISDQQAKSISRYLFPQSLSKTNAKSYANSILEGIITSEAKSSFYNYFFLDAPLPSYLLFSYIYCSEMLNLIGDDGADFKSGMTGDIQILAGNGNFVTPTSLPTFIDLLKENKQVSLKLLNAFGVKVPNVGNATQL